MIATVVGAPLEDAAELHRLSNLLQSQFDAIALMTRRDELEQAAAEFDAYVRRLVDERRSSPGDDLVSAMIAAEQEGDRLSDEECVSLVRDVLNGGIDTTQSALAHGVRLFASHPDQWAALGADASLAPQAAEEVLRFEPVAPFTTRVLLEDVEFRDVAFPAGTVVFASAWNANREAEGDSDPERFDFTAERGAAKSLTFGAGAALLHGRQPRARRAAGGPCVPRAPHDRPRAGRRARLRHDHGPLRDALAARALGRLAASRLNKPFVRGIRRAGAYRNASSHPRPPGGGDHWEGKRRVFVRSVVPCAGTGRSRPDRGGHAWRPC